MKNFRNYLQLHLNILLFSLTSVFSKLASIQYNKNGLHAPLLYVFLFLMIANCGIYAIAWQQVIKKFSLSTAYANKSVYLLWSQIWAVAIFHEQLSVQNIIGILIVLFGVWTEFFTNKRNRLKRCICMMLHFSLFFFICSDHLFH